jgi:hypothetical protein
VTVVALELDTRPPKVRVPSIRDIAPPLVWDAVFEADEELGPVTFVLADAIGDEYLLGHTVEGTTITVRVPTTTLLAGPAVLKGWVADTVCNVTRIEVPIHVLGEPAFEATLTMGRAYGAIMTIDQAYEAVVTILRAYGARETHDQSYDAIVTTERAYDATGRAD